MRHLKGATYMCGTNDMGFSTGIYDAELHAILRALIAVPVSQSIIIHSDNKSAVSAISRSTVGMSQRELFRRSARQWLNMIACIIGRKHEAGAKVEIRHVQAHTESDSKESVGNRCADLLAKHTITTYII